MVEKKIPLDDRCKGLRNYSKCSTEEEVNWKEPYNGLIIAKLNQGFPMQFPCQYNHSSPCLPLMVSPEKMILLELYVNNSLLVLMGISFLTISRKINCYSSLSLKRVKPNDA